MHAPYLEINLDKLRLNAKTLKKQCDEKGVKIAFTTKGFCAEPKIIRAVKESGIDFFADSRIKNIAKAKSEIEGLNYLLIRIPMMSEVEDVVKYVDVSLESEIKVMEKISQAAQKQGKIHKVILMIDVGDLREGVMPEDALSTVQKIKTLKGIELIGIGTNVGCYGSIMPSVKNTTMLVDIKNKINEELGMELSLISGGSTCTLALMEKGELHEDINNLRIGEALLLGEDSTNGRFLEGLWKDSFILHAEVIELKEKPSMPIGEMGFDSFGQKPVYIDKGIRKRAILAVGKQDVKIDALTPMIEGIEILGGSSDHTIIDVTDSKEEIYLGKIVAFRCGYTAMLSAMTSAYIDKEYLEAVK